MTLREAEPFAVGYLESGRNDIEYCMAHGLREFARFVNIKVNTDDWFQGLAGNWGCTGIRYSRTDGTVAREKDFVRQSELFPELTYELRELYDKFIPLDFSTYLDSLLSENEKSLLKISAAGVPEVDIQIRITSCCCV